MPTSDSGSHFELVTVGFVHLAAGSLMKHINAKAGFPHIALARTLCESKMTVERNDMQIISVRFDDHIVMSPER